MMSCRAALPWLLTLCSIVGSAPTGISTATDSLPTVDLGYELHKAIVYNETYSFYNFSNIPFAAPPLGSLRFAAPQAPPTDRSVVNLGNVKKICPQAGTSWGTLVENFAISYLEEIAIFGAASPDFIPLNTTVVPFEWIADPLYTEDCLVLDIVVPESIYNGGAASKAPVLVEIFGGGYVAGDKSSIYVDKPDGLLHRGNNSFIYVTMNYRLGAFGFLAGSEFVNEGGVANAGLLDQRFALDWVQQYISLFGGDPEQVTVIGESAGGGSIMHQITAYGGANGSVPFIRAIPQSPGFSPVTNDTFMNTVFTDFLVYANVSSLDELRGLDTDIIMRANAEQVYSSNIIGSYTYGPVVDGTFVPELPGVLLSEGKFDQKVSILAGHNLREGYTFTSPYERNDSAIISQSKLLFPGITDDTAEYIVDVLYPDNFNGSYGYTDWWQRATQITTESAFICNAYYMTKATSNQSYGYLFNIFPAIHGQDIAYTFYDGTPANASDFTEVQNVNTALTLQDYIVTFTVNGAPTTSVVGSPNLPVYGASTQIGILVGLGATFSASIGVDNAANPRCDWWQRGLE